MHLRADHVCAVQLVVEPARRATAHLQVQLCQPVARYHVVKHNAGERQRLQLWEVADVVMFRSARDSKLVTAHASSCGFMDALTVEAYHQTTWQS